MQKWLRFLVPTSTDAYLLLVGCVFCSVIYPVVSADIWQNRWREAHTYPVGILTGIGTAIAISLGVLPLRRNHLQTIGHAALLLACCAMAVLVGQKIATLTFLWDQLHYGNATPMVGKQNLINLAIAFFTLIVSTKIGTFVAREAFCRFGLGHIPLTRVRILASTAGFLLLANLVRNIIQARYDRDILALDFLTLWGAGAIGITALVVFVWSLSQVKNIWVGFLACIVAGSLLAILLEAVFPMIPKSIIRIPVHLGIVLSITFSISSFLCWISLNRWSSSNGKNSLIPTPSLWGWGVTALAGCLMVPVTILDVPTFLNWGSTPGRWAAARYVRTLQQTPGSLVKLEPGWLHIEFLEGASDSNVISRALAGPIGIQRISLRNVSPEFSFDPLVDFVDGGNSIRTLGITDSQLIPQQLAITFGSTSAWVNLENVVTVEGETASTASSFNVNQVNVTKTLSVNLTGTFSSIQNVNSKIAVVAYEEKLTLDEWNAIFDLALSGKQILVRTSSLPEESNTLKRLTEVSDKVGDRLLVDYFEAAHNTTSQRSAIMKIAIHSKSIANVSWTIKQTPQQYWDLVFGSQLAPIIYRSGYEDYERRNANFFRNHHLMGSIDPDDPERGEFLWIPANEYVLPMNIFRSVEKLNSKPTVMSFDPNWVPRVTGVPFAETEMLAPPMKIVAAMDSLEELYFGPDMRIKNGQRLAKLKNLKHLQISTIVSNLNISVFTQLESIRFTDTKALFAFRPGLSMGRPEFSFLPKGAPICLT